MEDRDLITPRQYRGVKTPDRKTGLTITNELPWGEITETSDLPEKWKAPLLELRKEAKQIEMAKKWIETANKTGDRKQLEQETGAKSVHLRIKTLSNGLMYAEVVDDDGNLFLSNHSLEDTPSPYGFAYAQETKNVDLGNGWILQSMSVGSQNPDSKPFSLPFCESSIRKEVRIGNKLLSFLYHIDPIRRCLNGSCLFDQGEQEQKFFSISFSSTLDNPPGFYFEGFSFIPLHRPVINEVDFEHFEVDDDGSFPSKKGQRFLPINPDLVPQYFPTLRGKKPPYYVDPVASLKRLIDNINSPRPQNPLEVCEFYQQI